MTTTRAAASSILLALLLVGGLTACDPVGDTSNSGDDESSETETDDTETDDGGFAGATVSGTGDYALPADMPIGGYELPDNQDGQPDGCTWAVYVGDDILGENNGPFVFITDVTTRFVTDGCPDWVQFE
jgi:hypothetical protein